MPDDPNAVLKKPHGGGPEGPVVVEEVPERVELPGVQRGEVRGLVKTSDGDAVAAQVRVLRDASEVRKFKTNAQGTLASSTFCAMAIR